jgi:hypothetical protein
MTDSSVVGPEHTSQNLVEARTPYLPTYILERRNMILRKLGDCSKCRRHRHEGCWKINSVAPQGLRLKGQARLHVPLVSF